MLCVLIETFVSVLHVPTTKRRSPQTKRFGRNVAQLRTKLNLTQEELAERASISARYVQDLEAGFYAPTIFLADAIRRALRCDWEDLLKGC
jgi:transcriptional regulator with XRE-family HTH domain